MDTFTNSMLTRFLCFRWIGLVFGIFELVIFILSPIFGQYMNVIGPKVLFNGGILTTSISSLVFGLLDKVEVSDSLVLIWI